MPRRPPGSRTGSIWHRPAPTPSRRASAPAFSREEITRAAIELADSHGLTAVSMRRIAERIGCAPTSLYWYVSDKSEIYELMFDAALGEIELPDGFGDDWRTALAALAWATLATSRRHRWYSQIGIQPVPGPNTLRYADVMLPVLAKSGMDETTGINVLATLNNYTAGFMQRELAWRQQPGRSTEGGSAEGTADGAGVHVGESSMTERGIAARLKLSEDESFGFGLDRVLDGIAVLVDSLRQQSD